MGVTVVGLEEGRRWW